MAERGGRGHDMTQGSVRHHILRMTLMMLAAMLLQTAYSLVDIYWVAHLGKEAVAAVGIASNLNFLTIGIAQMIGVGTVALIAQAFGRKDEAAVQRNFNQAQCLSMLAGVLFLLAMAFLSGPFARSFASDAATAALCADFLAWFIPALALQFTMIGIGSALRGIGNMRPGLVAQAGSVVLNMILAPILIFGWLTGHPFGVAGAAMATFIATVAAVAGLALYLKHKATFFRINFADWKPDLALWRKLLGIGLPAGTEFGVMTILLLVIYGIISSFGAESQAGFGIAIRIMQSGFMPAVCLSFAVAAVVGQNYGANQHARVRESFVEGAKLNILMMAVFTALCHITPAGMMRLFSQDPAVVEVGATYLRVVSYNYIAFGLIVVAGGVFQGLGNTWPSLISSVTRVAAFILIALWLKGQPGFGLVQLWWVSVASVGLQMVLALLFLRREFGLKLPPAPTGAAAAVVPPA